MVSEELQKSIKQLNNWIEENGWAGYDPYDIKGHTAVIQLLSNQARDPKLINSVFLECIEFFPTIARKTLKVNKEINAKAMGLFASAYLFLYQILKHESYLQKAYDCLRWLVENKSKDFVETCWGYPFDWQSLIFIPKGTPSAVVSSICGDAFLNFYKFTGDKKYLQICESICKFFINSLNIDFVDQNRICFSYTPLDNFHVHNANLFVSSFLIKVSYELGHSGFYEYGLKALNYTLDAQNTDGSFYYWSQIDKNTYNIPDITLKNIDHYHTGFVLRSLHSIYSISRENKTLEALTKAYSYYRDNLFKDNKVPKLKPDSLYPINIHSCAEAILCMSTLSDIFPDALEYAQNTFLWTRKHMQTREGWFIYIIRKIKSYNWKIKIPYIRWGQAWMLIALTNFLYILKRKV